MLTLPIFLCVTIAYIVKGISGFANTLVFSTLAGFFTDTVNISPVDLLIGYPSNLVIAWKERKSINLKVCLPLCALVVIGSIPGAFFLQVGDARLLKVILGIVVVFIGVEMYFRERAQKKQAKPSNFMLISIGLISGVLSGLFGVTALLVAYVSRTTNNQSEFRANNCVVFTAANTFRLILYSASGILTLETIKTAACLLPFMFLGLGIGMFFQKRLNERTAKNWVIGLLVVSGLSLITTNLF